LPERNFARAVKHKGVCIPDIYMKTFSEKIVNEIMILFFVETFAGVYIKNIDGFFDVY
jgi:hypothetical protein